MENLPIEIQWNIFKFMRHPTAEIFMDEIAVVNYDDGDDVYSFASYWLQGKMYEKFRIAEEMRYNNDDVRDADRAIITLNYPSDGESDDDYCPDVYDESDGDYSD